LAFLAMLLCGVASEPLFLNPVSAQEQQPDDKNTKAGKPSEDGATQASSGPASPAKSVDKPKKIITNDDIKSSPFVSFGGLFYMNSGSINDCDANCFDQVRLFSFQPGSEKNPTWRHDVLEQLEMVRSDSEWQGYLRQLYDAHNRICHLTFDKQDEMRRSGNTRNMGPQEIAITEKYDEKMKAAQDDLSALAEQQSAIQKRFADKQYANSFATVQSTRMRSGFCSQARVIYLQ
jgi:hypothetical protein